MSKLQRAQAKFLESVPADVSSLSTDSDMSGSRASKNYATICKKFKLLLAWTDLIHVAINSDHAGHAEKASAAFREHRDAVWRVLGDFIDSSCQLMKRESQLVRTSDVVDAVKILKLFCTIEGTQIRVFKATGERAWTRLLLALLDIHGSRESVRAAAWKVSLLYLDCYGIDGQDAVGFLQSALFISPNTKPFCSPPVGNAIADNCAVNAMKWGVRAWEEFIAWLLPAGLTIDAFLARWTLLAEQILPVLFPRVTALSGYVGCAAVPTADHDCAALDHPLSVEVLRILVSYIAPAAGAAARAVLHAGATTVVRPTGNAAASESEVDGMTWPVGASAALATPLDDPSGSMPELTGEHQHQLCERMVDTLKYGYGPESFAPRAAAFTVGQAAHTALDPVGLDIRYGFARISVLTDNLLFLATLHITPGSEHWQVAAAALRLRAACAAQQLRNLVRAPRGGISGALLPPHVASNPEAADFFDGTPDTNSAFFDYLCVTGGDTHRTLTAIAAADGSLAGMPDFVPPGPSAHQEEYAASPFRRHQRLFTLADVSSLQRYFRALCTALTGLAVVSVPPSRRPPAAVAATLPLPERFLDAPCRLQRWPCLSEHCSTPHALLAERANEQVAFTVAFLGSCLAAACPLPGRTAWMSVTRALADITAAAIRSPVQNAPAHFAGEVHSPPVAADVARAALARLTLIPLRAHCGTNSPFWLPVRAIMAARRFSAITYSVWGSISISTLRAALLSAGMDCHGGLRAVPVLTDASRTSSPFISHEIATMYSEPGTGRAAGAEARESIRPACFTLNSHEFTHRSGFVPDAARCPRGKGADTDPRRVYESRLSLTGGAAAATDDAFPECNEAMPLLESAATVFFTACTPSVLFEEVGLVGPALAGTRTVHGSVDENDDDNSDSEDTPYPLSNANSRGSTLCGEAGNMPMDRTEAAATMFRSALALIDNPCVAPVAADADAVPDAVLLNYTALIIGSIVSAIAEATHDAVLSFETLFKIVGPWLLRLATLPVAPNSTSLSVARAVQVARAASTLPAITAAISALSTLSFRHGCAADATLSLVAAVSMTFESLITLAAGSEPVHPALEAAIAVYTLPALFSRPFCHIVAAHASALATIAGRVAISTAPIDASVRSTAARMLGAALLLPGPHGIISQIEHDLKKSFNALCALASGESAHDAATRAEAVVALGNLVQLMVNELCAADATAVDVGVVNAAALAPGAPAPRGGPRRRARLRTAAFDSTDDVDMNATFVSTDIASGNGSPHGSGGNNAAETSNRKVSPSVPSAAHCQRISAWVPDSVGALPPPLPENPSLSCFTQVASSEPLRKALDALCVASLPRPDDVAASEAYYHVAAPSSSHGARVACTCVDGHSADPFFTALTVLSTLSQDPRLAAAFIPTLNGRAEPDVHAGVSEARARAPAAFVVDRLMRHIVYIIYAQFAQPARPGPPSTPSAFGASASAAATCPSTTGAQVSNRLLRLTCAMFDTIGDWLVGSEAAGHALLAAYTQVAETEHAEYWMDENKKWADSATKQSELTANICARIPPPGCIQKLCALLQCMTLNSMPPTALVRTEPDAKHYFRRVRLSASALEVRIALNMGARSMGLGGDAGVLPAWLSAGGDGASEESDAGHATSIVLHQLCIATVAELKNPTPHGASVRVTLRSPAGKFVYLASAEPGGLPPTVPFRPTGSLIPHVSGPASVGPGTALDPAADQPTSKEVAEAVAAGVPPSEVGAADAAFCPAAMLVQPVSASGISYFDLAQAGSDPFAVAMRDASARLAEIDDQTSAVTWPFSSMAAGLTHADIASHTDLVLNAADAADNMHAADVVGSSRVPSLESVETLLGTHDDTDPELTAFVAQHTTALADAMHDIDEIQKLLGVAVAAERTSIVDGVVTKPGTEPTPAADDTALDVTTFGPAPRVAAFLSQTGVLDLFAAAGLPAPAGAPAALLQEPETQLRKRLRRLDRISLIMSHVAAVLYVDGATADDPSLAFQPVPPAALPEVFTNLVDELGWEIGLSSYPHARRVLGWEGAVGSGDRVRYWACGTQELLWLTPSLMPPGPDSKKPLLRRVAAAVVWVDDLPAFKIPAFVEASDIPAKFWYFCSQGDAPTGNACSIVTVTPYATVFDPRWGAAGEGASFALPAAALGAMLRTSIAARVCTSGSYADTLAGRIEAIEAATRDAIPLTPLDAIDRLLG